MNDMEYDDCEKNRENDKSDLMSLNEVFNWAESVILPIITVILFMMFIARVNHVFGISMEPTLYEGDRIIVSSLLEPKYGDIVIVNALHLPNDITGEMGEPIVKRVIGLEGDVIFIDAQTGDVYRNNELLTENYVKEKITAEQIGNQEYPLTVPKGEVFVLGDNRNHSTDSRIAYEKGTEYYVGCIDKRYVMGVALFRLFPFDSFV